MIDPISSENIRRLFDQDPDKALENDEFLKLCKRTATDSELSRTVQRVYFNDAISHTPADI